MFVSEYLKLGDKLKQSSVFDSLIDKDSHFFINIIRLRDSEVPEFSEAYEYMNRYFTDIAQLLDAADAPTSSDKMYREARKKFSFHEVNGINLGFSSTSWGAGWGRKMSDKVLRDAFQIVKKGSNQPEIFQLVGLFEEDVAGDRLSDMIATIIEPYIKRYTIRMLGKLGIDKHTRKELSFSDDGIVLNPYKKGEPILLLPEEILHELPIAKNWDDIDRAVSENEAIRREINSEIGSQWEKWASSEKKAYLRKCIFMDPDACGRVISEYRKEKLTKLNLMEDSDYLAEMLLKKVRETSSFGSKVKEPSSIDAAIDVVGIFKDWVENNRGWAEIQDSPTKKREKTIQRLIHLGAKYYIETNNLDSSFECNAGAGAVDLKISRGSDRTVIEVKLSSNPQYLHGFIEQVKKYEKAEKTEKGVYVFINLGNSTRKERIISTYRERKASSIHCPELVVIDATHKDSASVCWDDAPDSWDAPKYETKN
ncbi:hypothetical protein IJN73_01140 [Candidatus Saccharibacteria bacterium]|nr:hypothetical protein [Candidatus Saccharibacteria bacterium]